MDFYRFRLYDMYGKKVMEPRKFDPGNSRVDISDLSPGMYYYSIRLAEGSKRSGKLIVK